MIRLDIENHSARVVVLVNTAKDLVKLLGVCLNEQAISGTKNPLDFTRMSLSREGFWKVQLVFRPLAGHGTVGVNPITTFPFVAIG